MDLKNIFTSPSYWITTIKCNRRKFGMMEKMMHRRKFGMMEKMMHRRKILRRKTKKKTKTTKHKTQKSHQRVKIMCITQKIFLHVFISSHEDKDYIDSSWGRAR